MSQIYPLPAFLHPIMDQASYSRWLSRKARAHHKRDVNRGNRKITVSAYKAAIHKAVCLSEGRDAYTGEKLDWSLLGTYDNEKSRLGKRQYKAQFSMLPTVDHVGDGLGAADFLICGWQVNDAKNDLSYEEFVGLCRKVVAKFGSRSSNGG